MKTLSAAEFEPFLNSIAYEWLLSEENANKFRLAGINPLQWPKFPVKRAMLDFLAIEHKGFPFASAMVFHEHKISEIKTSELPDDLELLKATYSETLNYFRAKELAKQIELNPSRVHDLIRDFSAGSNEGLKIHELHKEIYKTFEKQSELVAKGKSIVSIIDFPSLSSYVGGFNPARITIITAKTGFGKTKCATTLARSASKTHPVVFVNMEMGKDDFVSMFIHGEVGISNTDWQHGRCFQDQSTFERVVKYKQSAEAAQPIYFTDGRTLSLSSIKSAIYALLKDTSGGFVFIDYDQKIAPDSSEEEWKTMLKAFVDLEDLAKLTNSHIFILAQANDQGNPKASLRSIQPASCVLNFTRGQIIDHVGAQKEAYYFKALKNRFGVGGFCLEVDYNPAQSNLVEGCVCTELSASPVLQAPRKSVPI